ncbi:Bestrophin, RFP-TM, chloride channel-domain-containing protein [Panaeolus papilionaceus]|nr:Bestrophin, RFP-TM, chloride channel-domain-containing protein [Panaeolus papilionaceus]
MVTTNPLFLIWTGKRFRATVIDDIFPQVLFYTSVSTVVTLVSAKTPIHLGVSNQMLTVLGIVLGLVITFRTTSAYEKYQDGRQMWTDIMVASRHLAELIWIHVPEERRVKKGRPKWSRIQVMTEKKTMVNLIQAYAVSVKHLLRGEPGIHYEDLYPFVAFLPKYANDKCPPGTHQDPESRLPLFWKRDDDYNLESRPISPVTETPPILNRPDLRRAQYVSEGTFVEGRRRANTTSDESSSSEKFSDPFPSPISISISTEDENEKEPDPMSVMPQISCKENLKPHRDPPDVCVSDYFPVFKCFVWVYHFVICGGKPPAQKRNRRRAYADIVESDVPMQIALVLSDYSALLMRENHIDQQIAGAMTSNLLMLQDTIANLERICNTPLPWAYQVHLQVTLGIYLILLPFQIYTAFGYITIVATFFTSFLLLGFLEIGQEIENPFNYDENDLDLDDFCFRLHRDLHAITTYKSPLTDRYFLNEWNKPFAPCLDKTALELSQMQDSDLHHVRNTMVKSWKKVDYATRKPRRRHTVGKLKG